MKTKIKIGLTGLFGIVILLLTFRSLKNYEKLFHRADKPLVQLEKDAIKNLKDIPTEYVGHEDEEHIYFNLPRGW